MSVTAPPVRLGVLNKAVTVTMHSKLAFRLILPLTLFAACGAMSQAADTQTPAAKAATVTEPQNDGAFPRVRLMSQEQYFNTLSYVFGPDILPTAHFAPF